jgi:type III pantothenate kinase
MPDLKLLIDQGNTRLKWVMARNGEVDPASSGRGNFEEFRQAFPADSPRLQAVILSSVAGKDKIQEVHGFCRERWSLDVNLSESKTEQGGVRSAYAQPGALGVDRWLAIIGAVACYGKPAVVWDLGTASTLDAVDQNGQHLGGFIYPGPATMLNSLGRDTKLQVPENLEASARRAVGAEYPGVSPGISTAACISRGVLAAQLGALNQFQRNVSARMGTRPRLIVTGGAADRILPLVDLEHTHDPWLVFRGMLVE